MARSFIENINLLANATVLAGGDIIDDANQARDEAVAAALEAEASADQSQEDQLLAADWARKAFNNPVQGSPGTGDDEYSSYHWSIVSSQNAAPTLINDAVVSLLSTWSSNKLNALAITKSDIGHDHNGDYEPPITKNTAFNKDFSTSGGNNGVSVIVPRSDHTHDGVYEPLINLGLPKLTAFNKDFGTSAGTVMEGNHLFDDRYMTIATYADGSVIKPTSIPWVLDANAPLVTEVPAGNHRHLAVGVDYTPNVGGLLTATTVQGALSQADLVLESLSISERCNITGGSSASATVDIGTPGTYEPVLIAFDSATSARNCQYNDGVQVYYNGDAGTNPGDEGVRLVEGMWSSTITLKGAPGSEYSITVLIKEDGGSWVVPNSNFSTEAADMISSSDGSMFLSLTGWISHLAEGTIIGLGITSTVAETIAVDGITATFSGAQDGAVVSTGLIINHADLTGTGASSGVHTTSDIQDLDTELLSKADKIVPGAVGNIATLDAAGNLSDSGTLIGSIVSGMALVTSPTADNIIVMDSGGDSADGGVAITDLALVGGNSAQVFEVATSVGANDAVNQLELSNLMTNYVLDSVYQAHLAATNPHMVTYTDTGAAPLVHAHLTSDITGLDDALLAKYSVVASQITDNIPAFETGDLLKDSGISISDINSKIVASDYATSTTGGTIKILVVGNDGYITTDGSTPGP